MYRAIPTDNKLCHQRHLERCQELHKEKLRSMRPTNKSNSKCQLNNSPPKRRPHLQQNLKRAQLDEERFAEIERENTILLEKMSRIMQSGPSDKRSATEYRPGMRLTSHMYPMVDNYISDKTNLPGQAVEPRSLNKEFRRRELVRITNENQSLLRRIQERQPFYNHLTWEEDRRQTEEYLRNITEFPDQYRGRRAYGTSSGSYESPEGYSYDDFPPDQYSYLPPLDDQAYRAQTGGRLAEYQPQPPDRPYTTDSRPPRYPRQYAEAGPLQGQSLMPHPPSEPRPVPDGRRPVYGEDPHVRPYSQEQQPPRQPVPPPRGDMFFGPRATEEQQDTPRRQALPKLAEQPRLPASGQPVGTADLLTSLPPPTRHQLPKIDPAAGEEMRRESHTPRSGSVSGRTPVPPERGGSSNAMASDVYLEDMESSRGKESDRPVASRPRSAGTRTQAVPAAAHAPQDTLPVQHPGAEQPQPTQETQGLESAAARHDLQVYEDDGAAQDHGDASQPMGEGDYEPEAEPVEEGQQQLPTEGLELEADPLLDEEMEPDFEASRPDRSDENAELQEPESRQISHRDVEHRPAELHEPAQEARADAWAEAGTAQEGPTGTMHTKASEKSIRSAGDSAGYDNEGFEAEDQGEEPAMPAVPEQDGHGTDTDAGTAQTVLADTLADTDNPDAMNLHEVSLKPVVAEDIPPPQALAESPARTPEVELVATDRSEADTLPVPGPATTVASFVSPRTVLASGMETEEMDAPSGEAPAFDQPDFLELSDKSAVEDATKASGAEATETKQEAETGLGDTRAMEAAPGSASESEPKVSVEAVEAVLPVSTPISTEPPAVALAVPSASVGPAASAALTVAAAIASTDGSFEKTVDDFVGHILHDVVLEAMGKGPSAGPTVPAVDTPASATDIPHVHTISRLTEDQNYASMVQEHAAVSRSSSGAAGRASVVPASGSFISPRAADLVAETNADGVDPSIPSRPDADATTFSPVDRPSEAASGSSQELPKEPVLRTAEAPKETSEPDSSSAAPGTQLESNSGIFTEPTRAQKTPEYEDAFEAAPAEALLHGQDDALADAAVPGEADGASLPAVVEPPSDSDPGAERRRPSEIAPEAETVQPRSDSESPPERSGDTAEPVASGSLRDVGVEKSGSFVAPFEPNPAGATSEPTAEGEAAVAERQLLDGSLTVEDPQAGEAGSLAAQAQPPQTAEERLSILSEGPTGEEGASMEAAAGMPPSVDESAPVETQPGDSASAAESEPVLAQHEVGNAQVPLSMEPHAHLDALVPDPLAAPEQQGSFAVEDLSKADSQPNEQEPMLAQHEVGDAQLSAEPQAHLEAVVPDVRPALGQQDSFIADEQPGVSNAHVGLFPAAEGQAAAERQPDPSTVAKSALGQSHEERLAVDDERKEGLIDSGDTLVSEEPAAVDAQPESSVTVAGVELADSKLDVLHAAEESTSTHIQPDSSFAVEETVVLATQPDMSLAIEEEAPAEAQPDASFVVEETAPAEAQPDASFAVEETAPAESQPDSSFAVEQSAPMVTPPKAVLTGVEAVAIETQQGGLLPSEETSGLEAQPEASSAGEETAPVQGQLGSAVAVEEVAAGELQPETSLPAPEAMPIEAQPEGSFAAEEAAPIETQSFAAEEAAPIEAQADGSFAAEEAAPIETQPEGSFAAEEAAPMEAQPEGSFAAEEAAPIETQSFAVEEAAPIEAQAEGSFAAEEAAPIETQPDGSLADEKAAPTESQSFAAEEAAPIETQPEGSFGVEEAAPVDAQPAGSVAGQEESSHVVDEFAPVEVEPDSTYAVGTYSVDALAPTEAQAESMHAVEIVSQEAEADVPDAQADSMYAVEESGPVEAQPENTETTVEISPGEVQPDTTYATDEQAPVEYNRAVEESAAVETQPDSTYAAEDPAWEETQAERTNPVEEVSPTEAQPEAADAHLESAPTEAQRDSGYPVDEASPVEAQPDSIYAAEEPVSLEDAYAVEASAPVEAQPDSMYGVEEPTPAEEALLAEAQPQDTFAIEESAPREGRSDIIDVVEEPLPAEDAYVVEAVETQLDSTYAVDEPTPGEAQPESVYAVPIEATTAAEAQPASIDAAEEPVPLEDAYAVEASAPVETQLDSMYAVEEPAPEEARPDSIDVVQEASPVELQPESTYAVEESAPVEAHTMSEAAPNYPQLEQSDSFETFSQPAESARRSVTEQENRTEGDPARTDDGADTEQVIQDSFEPEDSHDTTE